MNDRTDQDWSYKDALAVQEIDEAIKGSEFFRVGKYYYNQAWFEGENPKWAFTKNGMPYKIEDGVPAD